MVIIHQKIFVGKAHKISESDTEFFGVCTKSADCSVLTEQYNSSIKAKPRAYSFKSLFMTDLYRHLIHEIAPYSSMISADEWMKNPLEEMYKEKISRYHRMTQEQPYRRFGKKTTKTTKFYFCHKILGLSGKSNATPEMELAGIILEL